MLKIKAIDPNGKEVEKVVKEDLIEGISERKVAPTKLYDDQGQVASETPNESVYDIFLSNGGVIKVSQATYDKLNKKLGTETL